MDSRDAANRDLLFGLLGLQTGLVDQSALVAAFHVWTRDKSRPIAEILTAQGALDAGEKALLEGLAEKHLARHGGEAERSLAGLKAGRSIRECLAGLGDPVIEMTLEHAGSDPTEPDSGAGATMSMGAATSDGLRFRVLRPHARGGLGAVFVAHDAELDREVALKQILDHHADDPTSRARFLLEAQITGGLEHPGIVPVYGLGSYADGRPYYAMRFVRGDSLKEAIAAFHADAATKGDPGRRSLALRKVLRRFIDVCNAIDYAHTRGVIHRDIKPANVIVGKHGETLVVDWGLAKTMDRAESAPASDERTLRPSSGSGSAETLPGSALGTPGYMSPEQARGDLDRLGPWSDVYSLGATLYCLLAGRPPFEGDDLGAVLKAVREGDFPPPRAVDPAIDRALEAVCLKAMAAEPSGRYATPRALADDVERWAADEPVTAWSEPASRRARRWARRHRTAVAASAVAVLAALFGTAAVLAVQTRANGALKEANVALVAAKDREAARFGLAMEAIKLFHGQVGDELVLKEDRFKPLRDRLLKDAADFYLKLEGLLKDQPDGASRAALGAAYSELSNLTGMIGDKSASQAARRKAKAIIEETVDADPADNDARGKLAWNHMNLGWMLWESGKPKEAEIEYRKSLAITRKLAAGDPANTGYRGILGGVHNDLGIIFMGTGRPAEAEAELREALEIHQRLADDHPAVADFRYSLAMVHYDMARLLSLSGRTGGAEAEFRRARAILLGLADGDDPSARSSRSSLALCQHDLGWLLWTTGRPAEAEIEYRESLAITRKLANDNPALTDVQLRQALGRLSLGRLLSATGRPAEAEAEVREGLAISRKLVDDNPSSRNFRSSLAAGHNDLGVLLGTTGRPKEAEAEIREAMAIRRRLSDEVPDVTEFRESLAWSHHDLAGLLSRAGRTGEAMGSSERAVAIFRGLVAATPAKRSYRDGLARSLALRADALRAPGRSDEARAGSEGSSPRPGEDWYDLACGHAELAGTADPSRPDTPVGEGEAEAKAAIDALRRAVAAGYRDFGAMEKDKALAPLRSRPDFRLLMMDLAFPADPFARDG